MVAKTFTPSGDAPSLPSPAVLVIDGNEDHQMLSAIALGRRGFKVTTAATGMEGLRLALSQDFDAIILDHKVKDRPAFEILGGLVERLPHTPKIFVVAAGAEDQAVRALGSGATGYLVKTARYNEVLPLEVEDQIEKARVRARLEEQGRALAQGVAERQKVEEALREFEDRMGLMIEQAPLILWTIDNDLRFTSSIGSGLKRIGLVPNQVRGMTLMEFAQSDDPHLPLIAAHRRALGGESVRFEQEWKGRTFDVHVEPLRKKGGPILGVFGVALDITERVRAERVQAALYRISQAAATAAGLPDLFRSVHQIVGQLMPAKNFYIALHDPDVNTLSFPYFVDEKEDPPGPQPVGRGMTEYVLRTGQTLLASPEVFQQLLQVGEIEQVGPPAIDWLGVPLRARERVFGVLVVQSYTEGVRYKEAEKELLEFVCSQAAMVIERKRTEAGLEESQHLLSALVSRLPGVAYRTRNDEQWTNEFVSESCYDLLGYRSEDLIGSGKISGRDLVHPEDRARVREETDVALREKRPFRIIYRIRTGQGQERWVWDQGHGIYGPEGEAVAIEGLLTDVTEWKGLTDGLRTMGIFRALFDSASDAILLVDRKGTIVEVNPVAEALLARERKDILRRPLTNFLEPESSKAFLPGLEAVFKGEIREDSQEVIFRGPRNARRTGRLLTRLVREPGAEPMAELTLRNGGPEKVSVRSGTGNRALRPFA